jgi:Holliday junction resolvase
MYKGSSDKEGVSGTNTTVAKGRMAEYHVKRILERLGYVHIIRSFASLSPIDLIASNGSEVIAVQVKQGGYLSTEGRLALVDWADKFHAKPFLARKRRGRWVIIPVVLRQDKTEDGERVQQPAQVQTAYGLGVSSEMPAENRQEDLL